MMVKESLFELLKYHDCVIIPGFGGFLARYRSASVLPVTNRFLPPSRLVSFNSRLQTDDGLLINHISQAHNISTEKSRFEIENFVKSVRNQLDVSESYTIEKIGRFTLNLDDNLIFTPEYSAELWNEGFGLTEFFSPAIVRSEKKTRTVSRKEDRKPERKKSGLPVAVKMTVAVALPLIIFLVYGIINPSDIRKISTDYSGFFNFSTWNSESNTLRANVLTFTIPAFEYSNPASLSLIEADSRNEYYEKVCSRNLTGLDNEVRKGYHIIAGTFATKIAASAFIKKYQEFGYDPVITGTNNYGHFRVSVQSFAKKSEAIEFLATFREEDVADAWLIRI